ncbi:prophage endopeptidase tail family protein [Peribacillus kribbensis]|uniref:prophage endopeptidase tail family protein n=1 Tax=Peribacillus kribbensis TaxID=356658 RepID=UPI0003FDFE7C|nr:prophage endopeptidase tail family protein [Peribacillus kribbensis]
MLSITDLNGTTEPIVDYKSLVRKSAVNGERSLSFYMPKTELNQYAYPLIDSNSSVELDGHEYIIKSLQERTVGRAPVKTVTAIHSFFIELLEDHRYEILSTGDKTINQVMSFIFTGTNWTFSVIDSFDTETFEEFGNDNPLALFNQAIEKFEAEFDIVGNQVRIVKKLGSLIDMQFRFNHNIKTFQKDIDANNIYTYIKGLGKKLDDPYILDKLEDYSSRTGTWLDLNDPYHATEKVGATFSYSFTGTKIAFRYMVDDKGGMWEFVLDGNDTKKISTWGKKTGELTTVLFDGLESKNHTLIATFKGDDPNNKPSTGKGKSRGYVAHGTRKTFDVYRNRVGDEVYSCVAEYTSPEASKYPRLKHAPPYQSDTATSSAALLKELKAQLKDKPDMTISLEYTILKDAGYTGNPSIGDIVPTIYEPLNVDLDLRVIEVEDYPRMNSTDPEIPPKVTLSTSKNSFVKSVMNYQKAVLDKIYDESSKKLRYNVYDEAVKRATEALNNSMTELEYPQGMGILARDPNDPDRFVVFRSSGIGITTNGGTDFPNAITPDGVTTNLLTAGQIKTNNIQIIGDEDLFYWDGNALMAIDAANPNKYVKLNSDGLYSAGGSVSFERPDGYVAVSNGISNSDFAIQGGTPSYTDPEVEIVTKYFRTRSTTAKNIDYIVFKHDARYVNVVVQLYSEIAGSVARVEIYDTSGGIDGGNMQASYSTTETDPNQAQVTITIDMGVPTGMRTGKYIRLKTNNVNSWAYARIVSMYKEK